MIPVSVTAPQFSNDPAPLLELARDPGALSGIFLFDHLIPIGDPHRPFLELAAAVGAVAATGALRVGTLVLRATLRPPPVTAAIAATLGAIASGKVTIGLGIGDRLTADESRRFGMPTGGLDERVAELRTTIGHIRTAAPAIEVWVGGRHPKVRAVAAELADGWNCWGAAPSEFAVEAAAVRTGAGPGFRISWGGTVLLAPTEAELAKLVEKRGGAEGAIAGDPPTVRRHLTELAETADELVVSVVPNRRSNWDLLNDLIG